MSHLARRSGVLVVLVVGAAVMLAVPAAADTAVISYQLDGSEPTWTRVDGTAVPCAPPQGVTAHYREVEFWVDEAGGYAFVDLFTANDGFVAVYQDGTFDPAQPVTGCLGAFDDNGGGAVTVPLETDTTYTLVQTTFSAGVTGTFTYDVTGPGLYRPGALAPVTVSPAVLPTGTAGTAFEQTLTATGGIDGPYTFAVTSGTLPVGLTLAADGVLSGTPVVAGSSTFTVTATDASDRNGSTTYQLVVSAAAGTTTTTSTTAPTPTSTTAPTPTSTSAPAPTSTVPPAAAVLAVTGSSANQLVVTGGLLIATGALTLAARRRTRRFRPAHIAASGRRSK